MPILWMGSQSIAAFLEKASYHFFAQRTGVKGSLKAVLDAKALQ